MSGRGHGRSNINMTPAQLQAMINEHVQAAVAAVQAAYAAQGNHHHCTFKSFMDCKPMTFSGEEGAVGLLRWIEKSEKVFSMCNCPAESKVKFATGTFEGAALSWWNAEIQMVGVNAANNMDWEAFKELIMEEYCPRDQVKKLEGEFLNSKMSGSEIEEYTARYHEYAVLCPSMVDAEFKRIKRYLEGLVPQIKSLVTASNPTTVQQAIRLAHKLTDQEVERGTLPARISEKTALSGKRKAEEEAPATSVNNQTVGNQSGRSSNSQYQNKRSDNTRSNFNNGSNSGSNNRQGGNGNYKGKAPYYNKCGKHHNGMCSKGLECGRCGKLGHEANNCWTNLQKLNNNGQNRGGNNNNRGNGNNRNGQGNNQNNNNGGARGCFECGAQGHIKRDCPQLRRQGNGNNGNGGNPGNGNGDGGNGNGGNGNGGNGRGRAFVMGQGEARNDANVINDR